MLTNPIIYRIINSLPKDMPYFYKLLEADRIINLAYKRRIKSGRTEVNCPLYFQLMESLHIKYALFLQDFYSAMPYNLYEEITKKHGQLLNPSVIQNQDKLLDLTLDYIENTRWKLYAYLQK